MYIDHKTNKIGQLPLRTEGFDSVEMFKTYMDITTVRKAQQIEAAHIEFTNVKLQCFIKRAMVLSDDGKIVQTKDQYFVCIRLSEDGILKEIVPPPGIQVNFEWLRGAEFKNLKKPTFGKVTVRIYDAAHINELKSVKDFCALTRPQIVDVRDLLINSIKSSNKFDVRSSGNPEFAAQVFNERSEMARTKTKDKLNTMQLNMLKNMPDLSNCVLTVNGPPDEPWLEEKKLLRLESGSRQKMAMKEEAGHFKVVAAEEKARFDAAYSAFLAENIDNMDRLEHMIENLGGA
ncbi:MAG: hypothetical protein Q9169_005103 [Polycauliona sp. 2 TL-2023]